MNIPDGYRELFKGEIIKDDDLAFVDGYWLHESNLSENYAGKKYNRLSCYFTIREIKQDEENKLKISKEKIHLILENLRQEKAFNADSAFYPKDDEYSIYLEMEKKKIIKSIDYDKSGRKYFYLDKKDKNHLFLDEISEEKLDN